MDHLLMFQIKQNVTTIDFKDNPPKRCLDLGTGVRALPSLSSAFPFSHTFIAIYSSVIGVLKPPKSGQTAHS